MRQVFLIALFGALGALARYGLSELLAGAMLRRGSSFPLGILLINIAGSGLLAFVTTLLSHGLLSKEWSIILGVGFLGAFTTYSTFAVGTDVLLREGRYASAALYVSATLLGGALAVVAGRWMALKVTG